MHFTSFFTILAAPAMVLATLDPATSNTKGKYPTSPACSGECFRMKQESRMLLGDND